MTRPRRSTSDAAVVARRDHAALALAQTLLLSAALLGLCIA
jgi:hypothetical protein